MTRARAFTAATGTALRLRHVTPQELDPVGRVTAFYFTIPVGVASVGAAIFLTYNPSGYAQISSPLLAALAIAVLAGAFVAFVVMATPRGPILTRLRLQVVLSLVIAASVLSALSQFGSNHFVRDDWGPISIGLTLLACAPFRSSYEILWFTLQGVLAAGLLAVLQAGTSEVTVSGMILLIVAITPAAGIGLGAAAYSRSIVTGLSRLRAAEAEARDELANDHRQRLYDEDSAGELEALRNDVMPFFEQLLTQNFLMPTDSQRAIELSESLRVAIVKRLAYNPLSELVAEFVDIHSVARFLSERQRAALRALVGGVAALEGVQQESVVLALSPDGGQLQGVRGSLSFNGGDPSHIGFSLHPFVRMLGLECGESSLKWEDRKGIVRFSSTPID